MPLHDARFSTTGVGAIALLLGLGACAGGASPASEPVLVEGREDPEMPGCVIDRFPLTIAEGVYAYIEPEDLIQVGSSYVVVGTPSHTWAPGTPGDSLPLTIDRYFAARFTLDGGTTLIERPVPDSVEHVRSLPLGGDRWGVLFDVERDDRSGAALWYAEHDGTRWSLLEPMPLPPEGRLRVNESTEVVRAGNTLVWVVPVLPPNGTSQVVEYTRRDGAWRTRLIGDDWVEESTLTYHEGSGLWMARSGPDAQRRRKTLALYHRAPEQREWQFVRDVHVLRGNESARGPAITVLPRGLTVMWHMTGGEDYGAYAVVDLDLQRSGTLVHLDPEVIQAFPLRSAEGEPRWIVTHVNEAAGRVDLRMLGVGPLFSTVRLAATPSPYPAFPAALARTAEEAIIIGPEMSSDMADPFVRSLVLRLSTSCT